MPGQPIKKVYQIVTLIALLIAVLALYIVSITIGTEEISLDKVLAIVGVSISGIGFMVGTYFALLAVNAYSHVREIEHTRVEIENLTCEMRNEICKNTSLSKQLLTETVLRIEDFISAELNIAKYVSVVQLNEEAKNKIEKRQNYLLRERAILALRNDCFPQARRENLIRELFVVGKNKDLELIESVLQSPKENENIKRILKKVAERIRKRKK